MSAARTAGTRWVRTAAASLVVGLLTMGSLFAAMVALAPAADAADTTASPVTVTAQQQDADVADSPFPNLSVTVSQTKDLVNQGIRLTYSGGTKSTPPSSQNGGQNFLQVMECWDDLRDASGALVLDQNGERQPDRTTCQYGSANINQGQTRTTFLEAADPADVAAGYLYPGAGFSDPPRVSIPFRSATGKTLADVVAGKLVKDPTTGDLPNLDSNEFYGPYTTNEVPWAGFGADGTGTATYEVQTAMQAPGLDCGNPVTAADGTVTGEPCWLVILPRGDHDITACGARWARPSVRWRAASWCRWRSSRGSRCSATSPAGRSTTSSDRARATPPRRRTAPAPRRSPWSAGRWTRRRTAPRTI